MQEKLEMINVRQTFILPLKAAHLHEWLCNSHKVSASLQHLMAGWTRWLLTTVNMYICIPVWMFPAPLPSLPVLRQVLQFHFLPAPHHNSFFHQSGFLCKTWVGKKCSWRHCRDGSRRDVPLQWRSLCSYRSQQGFLHQLYSRWQRITLLCSWTVLKEANTYNVRQSVEFSEYRKAALDVESSFVHCLIPRVLFSALKEHCYIKELWKLSSQLEMFHMRYCDIQLLDSSLDISQDSVCIRMKMY